MQLVPPHSLQPPGFNPCAYEVKTRFQAFAAYLNAQLVPLRAASGSYGYGGIEASRSQMSSVNTLSYTDQSPQPGYPRHGEGAMLDGFAIVGACAADLPEECFQATLSGRGFVDVEMADLEHFGELSMLDVGDNLLRWGAAS
jgi:hypothetical protein